MPDKEKNIKVSNIQMAQFKPMDSAEKLDRKGWLKYGDDNLYPQYLNEVVDSAPVHGTLCVSIAEMIAGKGFESNNADFLALKPEKNLASHGYDIKVQRGIVIEVIYDSDLKDPTFAKFEALNFEDCRLAIAEDEDRNEVVTGMWYCKDWSDTRKYKPKYIPRYNWNKRVEERRQVYWAFGKTTNSRMYPKPDYERSMTWIEIERQIGTYHMNHLLNGLFPGFVMHLMNGTVSDEEATRIKNEIEKKLGAAQAGGVMITFNESDKTAPKIDPFPISDADKQYQFQLDASTRLIMVGHRATTPLIFGIRDGGGLGSNTDEMKTGLAIFENQVIEPYQRQICDAYIEIYEKAGVQLDLSIVKNSVLPEAEPAQTQQVKQEKKKSPLDEFIELGTDAPAGFILVDAFAVDYDSDDEDQIRFDKVNQTSTGTAFPNSKSEQDASIDGKLFITRYRYKGELRDNTREFCRKMLAADKLYRKEDIIRMENVAVNPGWGPNGTDTYSIWLYKGGGECHHFLQKEVYVSAEGFKIDVNNPNAQKTAVKAAEAMGYKIRNESLVARLPVDMPYNGFLPSNPRFN